MSNNFIAFVIMSIVIIISFMSISEAASTPWEDSVVVPDTPTDVLKAELTEVDCLAMNIYHEARGEGVLGHELVAQVTVNRMADLHYPDTACEVVLLQRRSASTGKIVSHFSWTLDGKSDVAANRSAYRSAYLLAIEYLYMGAEAPVKNFDKLLAYHADYVNPDWHDMKFVLKYNNHVFYVRA